MPQIYSRYHGIPLPRFILFAIYGSFDRTCIFLEKFVKIIMSGEKILAFSYRRDFSYIEKIVGCMILMLDRPTATNHKLLTTNLKPISAKVRYRIDDFGNNNPVEQIDYIDGLEISLVAKANLELFPLALDYALDTNAEVDELMNEFDYKPSMSVTLGVLNFDNWFKEGYK
jgi:UDP-glucuronate 4-epimerase